ncbi:unnamed protein product [Didymodactylos carnosus]|uniref:Uncharacterized protein n=1 Tax=Didymodactylos carnosus TaxID=1234261 RepID=A0A8S2EDQ7_9BILA|nr:unnamed protein product [Didymodactylos carnosus]CAF4008747.1 unnamed protein product [Didymodactylos carnosus]
MQNTKLFVMISWLILVFFVCLIRCPCGRQSSTAFEKRKEIHCSTTDEKWMEAYNSLDSFLNDINTDIYKMFVQLLKLYYEQNHGISDGSYDQLSIDQKKETKQYIEDEKHHIQILNYHRNKNECDVAMPLEDELTQLLDSVDGQILIDEDIIQKRDRGKKSIMTELIERLNEQKLRAEGASSDVFVSPRMARRLKAETAAATNVRQEMSELQRKLAARREQKDAAYTIDTCGASTMSEKLTSLKTRPEPFSFGGSSTSGGQGITSPGAFRPTTPGHIRLERLIQSSSSSTSSMSSKSASFRVGLLRPSVPRTAIVEQRKIIGTSGDNDLMSKLAARRKWEDEKDDAGN